MLLFQGTLQSLGPTITRRPERHRTFVKRKDKDFERACSSGNVDIINKVLLTVLQTFQKSWQLKLDLLILNSCRLTIWNTFFQGAVVASIESDANEANSIWIHKIEDNTVSFFLQCLYYYNFLRLLFNFVFWNTTSSNWSPRPCKSFRNLEISYHWWIFNCQ